MWLCRCRSGLWSGWLFWKIGMEEIGCICGALCTLEGGKLEHQVGRDNSGGSGCLWIKFWWEIWRKSNWLRLFSAAVQLHADWHGFCLRLPISGDVWSEAKFVSSVFCRRLAMRSLRTFLIESTRPGVLIDEKRSNSCLRRYQSSKFFNLSLS